MMQSVWSRMIGYGLVGTCLSLSMAMPAWAAKDPIPVATDRRVRTMSYVPNEVFRFQGHYGYQSVIEFEVGEEIQTISLGDSVAWQITPTDNRIFLKPIAQSADTNMTVITNRRIYLFELIAREAESMRDKEMVFVMRFIYPNSGGGNVTTINRELPIPDVNLDRARLNFNYTISGTERISPMRIFDDGRFTYFQFPRNMPDMPAFFTVDSQGNEALVNYRVREDYIIIERTAERYTLRYGPDIVCVYNERLYRGGEAPKQSAPKATTQGIGGF